MILIISVIIGFLFSKLISGKHEGDGVERSFRFLIKDTYIHVHHWIWCLALLIIFVLIGIQNEPVTGILVGSIIQGLMYKDRFVIIYNKDKFQQIYSEFR